MNLPPEKRSKGKSSTINTLKYALRCVKQVKGKRQTSSSAVARQMSIKFILSEEL